MSKHYIISPAIIGGSPDFTITEQQYIDLRRCNTQNFEAFEIELAFEFVIENYIEIEKYVAEHLIFDMIGRGRTQDVFRAQQWGFIRTLNNWLASIRFWHDLTRNRLISICGRGAELETFNNANSEFEEKEFVYGFIFHLRNYSQHGGFPLTGTSINAKWENEFTTLKFSANYTLDYDQIRSYFEKNGKGLRDRKKFGNRIEEYSKGKPFDLKPIVRQSVEIFGQFMDHVRSSMSQRIAENEELVLDMIQRFSSAYPNVSTIGLSAMPVDDRNIVDDSTHIVPVRDEFIMRSREMRRKNNGQSLINMDKRMISNV